MHPWLWPSGQRRGGPNWFPCGGAQNLKLRHWCVGRQAMVTTRDMQWRLRRASTFDERCCVTSSVMTFYMQVLTVHLSVMQFHVAFHSRILPHFFVDCHASVTVCGLHISSLIWQLLQMLQDVPLLSNSNFKTKVFTVINLFSKFSL